IPQVLVPKFPGALSALGILCSDVVKDYSRTLLAPAERAVPQLAREFRRLEAAARADLRREGFAPAAQRLERRLDLRYRGQAFELTLRYSRDFV
ncbi:hydantoinase/oxoprolinase family protein, partial [Acidobacteriia bacterium AH_259_A11_L15]|nr:hydantoinase/oxoprolinase family protein [Acidobacteriia bacterium AH_259_A11_L15]